MQELKLPEMYYISLDVITMCFHETFDFLSEYWIISRIDGIFYISAQCESTLALASVNKITQCANVWSSDSSAPESILRIRHCEQVRQLESELKFALRDCRRLL